MKQVLKILIFFLPWSLKRIFLQKCFGYKLDRTARIGYSWIFPSELLMGKNARIGHFNVAIHLDKLQLDNDTIIERGNWITGFSTKTDSNHFKHQIGRSSELIMGEHAAITKNHHVDCTSSVSIGKFTTIAGYRTQILTHSINIMENKQDSESITIGSYCFVGTATIILGGAILPDCSVLGAQSLLNKNFDEPYSLYGGVPAKFISKIPKEAKYFTRINGFVN
jgi:acetyltransferase-like isoleucine patch superfamily enzyme